MPVSLYIRKETVSNYANLTVMEVEEVLEESALSSSFSPHFSVRERETREEVTVIKGSLKVSP